MKFYIVPISSFDTNDSNITTLKNVAKYLKDNLKESQEDQITNDLISKFIGKSIKTKAQLWYDPLTEELARILYGNCSNIISGGERSFLLSEEKNKIDRLRYLEIFMNNLIFASSSYSSDNFIILTNIQNAFYLKSLINKTDIVDDYNVNELILVAERN